MIAARRFDRGDVPATGPQARAATPPRADAWVVSLDCGLYAFRLARGRGPGLPAVHVGALPGDGAVAIVDGTGRTASWLGARDQMLFVTVPTGGGGALVTAFPAGDRGAAPLNVEISLIGAAALGRSAAGSGPPRRPFPVINLSLGGAPAETRGVSLDVVAHIRGRGDVRFTDVPWIGRLGRGLWIEALTIRPRDPGVAAAIEYKGLTASGAETPWLPSGSPCGIPGRNLALIGFALRQKAGAGDALFDCECTGYFGSGASAGPARNGAPCRSAIDNDPLEGIQLRITPRPSRPVSTRTG